MPTATSDWSSISRSLSKTYRDRIWNPFIGSIKRYKLINENDTIAVCLSGGKDSFLLAACMKKLQLYSDFPFRVEYIAMDPGYSSDNLESLKENAEKIEIPLHVFESPIFKIATKQDQSPCYLCARMRRGYLYAEAQKIGCNKIALGHHLNDAIETLLLSMMYGSTIQAMAPILNSQNFDHMQLIRPLYAVKEDAILAWKNYHHFTFLHCSCPLSDNNHSNDSFLSKRAEIKDLIAKIKKNNPQIETNLFNSLHAIHPATFPPDSLIY